MYILVQALAIPFISHTTLQNIMSANAQYYGAESFHILHMR